MRADEVGNLSLAYLQSAEEKRGIGQLVLVRGIVQQVHRFGAGGQLLRLRARKTEVPEGVFVVDEQLVEERISRVHAMAENRVAELVRDYRGQAGLIWQNVDKDRKSTRLNSSHT